MPNYNKLYTPADSAIAFIDHQPQMTFGSLKPPTFPDDRPMFGGFLTETIR